MYTSAHLEPGYYEDGQFGIRIENVCIVKSADTPYCFDERGYLAFEHFTMVCGLALIPLDGYANEV